MHVLHCCSTHTHTHTGEIWEENAQRLRGTSHSEHAAAAERRQVRQLLLCVGQRTCRALERLRVEAAAVRLHAH